MRGVIIVYTLRANQQSLQAPVSETTLASSSNAPLVILCRVLVWLSDVVDATNGRCSGFQLGVDT